MLHFFVIFLSIQSFGQASHSWKLERMPAALETDFALSCLPPHVRPGATVYLLDPEKGYYIARQGNNGFICFVARTDWERGKFPQDQRPPDQRRTAAAADRVRRLLLVRLRRHRADRRARGGHRGAADPGPVRPGPAPRRPGAVPDASRPGRCREPQPAAPGGPDPSRDGAPERRYGGRVFRIGDKVTQLRNNYDKGAPGVFNGTVGVVTAMSLEEHTLTVRTDEDERVDYGFDELDELAHAYAVTIHRSRAANTPPSSSRSPPAPG